MNVILIVSDTVRQDYLGCYGNTWVNTPNIDALARDSIMFTNFFPASFPTRPHRKDLLTGRFTFTFDRWMWEWDGGEILLAELLKSAGYATALIHDTPSLKNLERGFDYVETIEGQQCGPVPEGTPEYKLPAKVRKLRIPMSRLQYLMYVWNQWKGEEDRFVCKTMRAAHTWLESHTNGHKPFFLMVDTFDPHEPWNPPDYYIDNYDPDYQGDRLFEPSYEPADYATPKEIQHMRCMYAGELTMVDRWIGHLLEGIDYMGLSDTTAVLFTSDHGYYHGEHNLIGKVGLDRKRNGIIHRWPLYDPICRVPLLMRIPGVRGGRVRNGLCQTPDITSTILDLMEIDQPESLQGKSLLPVIDNSRRSIRDIAVSSFTMLMDNECRAPANIRTRDHLYIHGGDEWRHELYDVKKDPEQKKNIIRSNTESAEKIHNRYIEFLREIECPSEFIDGRAEFGAPQRKKIPYKKLM